MNVKKKKILAGFSLEKMQADAATMCLSRSFRNLCEDKSSSYGDLDPAIGKGDSEDDEGGGHAEDDDVGQGRFHRVLTLPLPCSLPVPAFHQPTWRVSESQTVTGCCEANAGLHKALWNYGEVSFACLLFRLLFPGDELLLALRLQLPISTCALHSPSQALFHRAPNTNEEQKRTEEIIPSFADIVLARLLTTRLPKKLAPFLGDGCTVKAAPPPPTARREGATLDMAGLVWKRKDLSWLMRIT